jgi:hypothetical protein
MATTHNHKPAYILDIRPGTWHLKPVRTVAGPAQWTFYFLCFKVTKTSYVA